ncbi:MAG: hypothetical protein M1821_000703 [Bathelium mastoideum]|nr:MAG: hypothetical protein M1821_000703 [Bathelium mastoideum]
METRTSYKFKALTSSRSIRILELAPAQRFDALIKFSLREVCLETVHLSNNRFDALSYVWGSAKRDVLTYCDGGVILITLNCEVALRRLRRKHRNRRLWIDAICIDQQNDKERNDQVPLMRDVYSRARTTIVWLGEAPLPVWQMLIVRYLHPIIFDLINGVEVRKPERMRLDMKRYLHSNSWVARGWTVQEFAIPRSIMLLCGSTTFPLSCSAMRSLLKYSPRAWVTRLTVRDMVQHLQEEREDSSYSFMEDFWHFQCSDPRDSVYANYGMLQILGARPPLPDYSKTVEEILIEFATKILEETCSIDVLVSRRSMYRSTKFDLPTWVPDWTTPKDVNPWPAGGHYVASPAPYDLAQKSNDFRSLRLRGLCLGHNEKKAIQLYLWQRSVRFSKSIVDFFEWIQRSVREPQSPYMQDTTKGISEWDVLLYLLGPELHKNPQSPVTDDEMDIFINLCDGLSKLMNNSELQSWAYFSRYRSCRDSKGLRNSTSRSFRGSAGFGWSGTNYFKLSSGYFCSTKAAISENDVVIIAAGTHTPLILRPSGQQYIFIGPAFVVGAMWSEAWQEDAEQLEDFVLI